MTTLFLVIGAGLQGSAAAFDPLRQSATTAVTIVDGEVAQARPFLDPWRGIVLRETAL